ncbi:C-C motif chemokine 20a.3 [Pholidichthys leucotaenia]
MVSGSAVLWAVTLASLLLAANTSGSPRRCCRSYIKGRLRSEDIIGYSVQTIQEHCPIDAIIFHTKTGRFCGNPALQWVMDNVERIRIRAKKIHKASVVDKQTTSR